MDSSSSGSLLGFLPFILAIVILGVYLYYRSVKNRTVDEITALRTQVRVYQKEYIRLQKVSSAFSPEDPEPYGAMVENFNIQLIEFETSIDTIYKIYSEIHQQANQLKAIPFWRFWYLPLGWYQLHRQVNAAWQNIEQLEEKYQNCTRGSEKISNLGVELSNQSRDVIRNLNEALQLHQELRAKLRGDSFLAIGRQLKEWDKTLRTQIPLTFLSSMDQADPETQNKESITQVHRVLRTASPEVNGLNDKLKKWNQDLEFITKAAQNLTKKQQQIEKIIIELEKSPVSPLQWADSRISVDETAASLIKLESIKEMRSVEELRNLLHQAKRLEAKQEELDAQVFEVRDQYLDLLQIWSSLEVQQGNDWVRNANQVLEAAKAFDDENWRSIDDLGDFRAGLANLAKLQKTMLPKDPLQTISEQDVPGLNKHSRELFELHQNLRPRLEKINRRLQEIQRLQDEVKEKISGARSVLSKSLPIISSNPFLKKNAGNIPVKLQAGLDSLSLEFDTTRQGVIEKKVQRYNEWAGKAEQSFSQWLEILSEDIKGRLTILANQFQTLGNFNNLEDIAITEVKDILKKAEQSTSNPPLSRPGDLPLLVIANQLWAKNDHWQKVVAAGRALDDIAGPVLERYQKAEKSRQLVKKRLEKCDEVVPEEPVWPPTTQYLRVERKQAQTLDQTWQGLQWEHIQAIQLVGKLSDLTEQYQGLAINLEKVLEKAEQEQGKVLEYERRLDESKELWLKVVTKLPEYKTLRADVDQLLTEIDRDLEGLKKRSIQGGLPYNQVLQNLRAILHKINDATMPAAGNQTVDINGELQKRIF